MISCLIVNLNGLVYTKSLLNDILNQNYLDYEIFLIDQNSSESGTKEFFQDCLSRENFTVILNEYNKPLNHIWNYFVKQSHGEYCAFLNNDITITPNFLSDTVRIFENEQNVACVIHSTNHLSWNKMTHLNYKILENKTKQGWDFSCRKTDWIDIPEVLDFYCGDDFVFENIYLNNKKVAMALSSPVIHWLSQTRKSPLNKTISNRHPEKDIENYKKLGFDHYLTVLPEYSNISPLYHV